MIYFTADTHFNHDNIIEYCRRPFKSVHEMNSVLIDNWNSKVKNNDLIYHVGDFGFNDCREVLKQLNGKKILILGSHDRSIIQFREFFHQMSVIENIRIKNTYMTLCHYSMRVWDKSHYNSWNLYGHSHGRLAPEGKSYDVGVDCNNFFPISFEELEEIMKNRPDNFNYVGNKKGGTA